MKETKVVKLTYLEAVAARDALDILSPDTERLRRTGLHALDKVQAVVQKFEHELISPPTLYLFVTRQDVEPEILGPYKTTDARLKVARDIRFESDRDGVFRLDIQEDGTPEAFPFSGAEIEG